MFVAATDHEALKLIFGMRQRDLVLETNRQVADYAVKYVYGIDDKQLPFVQKHFGTKEQPRLVGAADEDREKMKARMLEIFTEMHDQASLSPIPP